MVSVYLVIKFNNFFKSYLVLGTYLSWKEANERLKTCVTTIGQANTKDTYYGHECIAWIKELKIGDNEDKTNYITCPDCN